MRREKDVSRYAIRGVEKNDKLYRSLGTKLVTGNREFKKTHFDSGKVGEEIVFHYNDMGNTEIKIQKRTGSNYPIKIRGMPREAREKTASRIEVIADVELVEEE